MSPLATALVLARGLGTRMREEGAAVLSEEQRTAAAGGAKALMPVGGHALVDHILSALADAGLTDALLVVPPEHAAFAAHFARATLSRITVDFVVQREPRGTADAVHAARDAIGDRPFLMVNGDNYYPVEALAAARRSGPHTLAGFAPRSLCTGGNIPEDRLGRFAFAWADEAGRLARMEEKPEVPPLDDRRAVVSMNLWAFGPAIFEACSRVRPSTRGELELIDAVWILARDVGEPVRVISTVGPVLDLSSRADVAGVEGLLAGHEVRL